MGHENGPTISLARLLVYWLRVSRLYPRPAGSANAWRSPGLLRWCIFLPIAL